MVVVNLEYLGRELPKTGDSLPKRNRCQSRIREISDSHKGADRPHHLGWLGRDPHKIPAMTVAKGVAGEANRSGRTFFRSGNCP